MRTACAVCFALLVAGVAASGQQPPPLQGNQKFRADVEAVEIDVRVVDEQGRLVSGLTIDDFELFEDGVRQEIKILTPVVVPFVPYPHVEPFIEPDTQSNRLPVDGRVYAFVLDDLHTHPLRSNLVKAAVRQFIDRHVGLNDRAALVVTSGRAEVSQELTGNRAALLRTLELFSGRKVRSAVLERIDEYYRLRSVRELESDENRSSEPLQLRDPLEFERVYFARLTLTSLRDVARWLERVPARRKALIFVSEGIEYDLRDFVQNRFASGLLADLQEAIAGARRSNTSIYAIDPRGLIALDDGLIELEGLPDDPRANLGQSAFAEAIRVMQDNLRVLSEETGGFAIVNSNDFAGGFERLVRENSQYYVLGYQSTNPRRDGRYRRVDVRVKKPGLRVIARRGYWARDDEGGARARKPAPEPPPLRTLLESPLPVSGLPLDTHVAVFRGPDGRGGSAVVTVEVGPGVGFTQQGEVHKGRVDVGVLAIDKDGKIASRQDRGVELNARPRTREAIDRHGLRTTLRFDLKPGKYQIRIAAHDRTSGRGGSVMHDIVVPDHSEHELAVSPLLVGSMSSLLSATTNVDEQLKGHLKYPPTAMRAFAPGDELSVFAEVYDNRKRRDPVVLLTTLEETTGRIVFRVEERLESMVFDDRQVYRHRAEIPLKGVQPGRYILKVTATPSRADAQPVTQAVALSVPQADGPAG